MGSAVMAFWACVDDIICGDRSLVRYSILQSKHGQNSVDGGYTIRAQPSFQLRFYAHPVRAEEQSPRFDGYRAHSRHARLGTVLPLARFAGLALGCLREHSLSCMDRICYLFAVEYYVFE